MLKKLNTDQTVSIFSLQYIHNKNLVVVFVDMYNKT